MTLKSDQIKHLEIEHNVYIDPDSMQFNLNGYDEVYGWEPIPDSWLNCECCGDRPIGDNDEMLCNDCYKEL
ncbi:MAG: hypothetical protein KJN62_03035 [Deltaproteobacteria bacterium]|nr:hypothetical protein [Deltaproteobacteria bacterium]